MIVAYLRVECVMLVYMLVGSLGIRVHDAGMCDDPIDYVGRMS